MLFQITLTVIGRPKYYAADMRGAEIRIHLVLKSRQHHSFLAPPPPACLPLILASAGSQLWSTRNV